MFSTIRRFAALFLLLSAAGALAAGWDDGAGPDWAPLLAKARQEGTMVLSGCPEWAQPVAKAFKADTGIEVSVIVGEPARVRAEAQSGRGTIDVHIGSAQNLDLAMQGLLFPIRDALTLPGTRAGEKWLNGRIKWADKAGAFMPVTSEYVSTRPLINRDMVGASIRSAQDLLKPEWKGKIAAADPTSGAGQVFALYYGALFGKDFVEKLYKGQEIVVSSDYRQLAEWSARGLYPIALGVDPVAVQRFREAGVTSLAFLTLSDAPGSLSGGCSVPSFPKSAPHPAAAAVFLNWFLSTNGQKAFVEATQLPSLRIDANGPKILADFVPGQGVEYLDQYEEDWYLVRREVVRRAVAPVFGR